MPETAPLVMLILNDTFLFARIFPAPSRETAWYFNDRGTCADKLIPARIAIITGMSFFMGKELVVVNVVDVVNVVGVVDVVDVIGVVGGPKWLNANDCPGNLATSTRFFTVIKACI